MLSIAIFVSSLATAGEAVFEVPASGGPFGKLGRVGDVPVNDLMRMYRDQGPAKIFGKQIFIVDRMFKIVFASRGIDAKYEATAQECFREGYYLGQKYARANVISPAPTVAYAKEGTSIGKVRKQFFIAGWYSGYTNVGVELEWKRRERSEGERKVGVDDEQTGEQGVANRRQLSTGAQIDPRPIGHEDAWDVIMSGQEGLSESERDDSANRPDREVASNVSDDKTKAFVLKSEMKSIVDGLPDARLLGFEWESGSIGGSRSELGIAQVKTTGQAKGVKEHCVEWINYVKDSTALNARLYVTGAESRSIIIMSIAGDDGGKDAFYLITVEELRGGPKGADQANWRIVGVGRIKP